MAENDRFLRQELQLNHMAGTVMSQDFRTDSWTILLTVSWLLFIQPYVLPVMSFFLLWLLDKV